MKLTITLIIILIQTTIFSQQGWFNRGPLPQQNLYGIKFVNSLTGFAVGTKGCIVKSTNAGTSWITLNSGTPRNLNSLYFIDANTGFIVGDSGVILETTNNGNNWNNISLNITKNFKSVFFINNSTGFITGTGGTVYKSLNGGINWVQQSVPTLLSLNSVFFTDANTGYTGGDSALYKTTTGGNNWSRILITGYGIVQSICFPTGSIGYIIVGNGLMKTTDSGTTWNTVWGASSMYFLNSLTGFASFDYGDIVMSKTTNGGINWMAGIVHDYNAYHSVSIVDSNNVYVAGDGGIIQKTTNAGVNWNNCGGTNFSVSSVSCINPNSIVMSANYDIFKTSDAGNAWTLISYGNTGFESSSTQFKVSKFIDANTGFAGTWRPSGNGGFPVGGVARTTDGGLNWTGYSLYFANFVDIAVIDNNNAYACGSVLAGANGSIMKTTNGINWVVCESTSPYYNSISFVNANTGCASGLYYTEGRISVTTNGGANWISQVLPSTKSLRGIYMTDALNITAVGDSGTILKTTNGGALWSLSSLGNQYFFNAVKFVNINTGWIVGKSGVILNTTNGGLNWLPQQSNTTKNLTSVSFFDVNYGVVGGDSGTVLYTSNGGITFVNNRNENTPQVFLLSQNYPNPFNPSTKIKFDLPSVGAQYIGPAQLKIYDILGKEVAALVNENLQPGTYEVTWDASNFPSGTYFYKLTSGDYSETKKMILMK